MANDTMTISGTDGKSRVFDADGNLISVDGVKVKKDPPPAKPEKKEGGNK